jgi:hypothetical protein
MKSKFLDELKKLTDGFAHVREQLIKGNSVSVDQVDALSAAVEEMTRLVTEAEEPAAPVEFRERTEFREVTQQQPVAADPTQQATEPAQELPQTVESAAAVPLAEL